MATELAVGYVSLLPSTKGLGKSVASEFTGIENRAARTSRGIGSKLFGGIKGAAKVAGVGAAAVLGTALTRGFQRLTAIENAEAKLTGLGHSAKTVERIMGNALGSVKGTAFGLDEAGTVAAGVVAAGIKPGKELERVLSLTADTATIAGTSMGEMGSIFNKVAAGGIIQGEEIAQLGDRGIPILQFLAKELGVTALEAKKMASEGKVDFDTFANAMEAGLGGAAQDSGKTTSGAFKNMLAALSRTGVALIEGVFPHFKTVFTGITRFLDRMNEKIGPVANAFGKELAGGLIAFGAAWKQNNGDVTSSGFPGFMERVANSLRNVQKWMQQLDFSSIDAFLTSLKNTGGDTGGIFASIGDSMVKLAPAFKEFAATLPTLAGGGLQLLAGGLKFLADNVDTIVKYMPLLIAGFVAWKIAQRALNAVQILQAPIMVASNVLRLAAARTEYKVAAAKNASTAATARSNTVEKVGLVTRLRATTAAVASAVAERSAAAAKRVGAVAQRVLNAAMRANPIGIVITAIAALVAGLVWFFTQTKTGRKVIETVWGAIKKFIGATVKWFKTYVLPQIKTTFDKAGKVFSWLYKNIVKPIFGLIKAYIRAWWTVVKAIFKAVGWFIENVLGPVFRWLYNKIVKPVMGWIGDKIRGVWRGFIKPAFDAIGDAVKKLPKAFEAAKDGIGRAWNRLREIAKIPVRFVVNRVINDGLIGTFNKIPGVDIPEIKLPKGFAKGGLARGWSLVGEEGPELVNFTQPGRVYTAKETGAALRHHDDGRATAANGGSAGRTPPGMWSTPLAAAIRNMGNRLFIQPGAAANFWQMPGAASVLNGASGLRLGMGMGAPRVQSSIGGLPVPGAIAYANFPNNIRFAPGGGRFSPAFRRATSIHEIMHLLGFPHTNAASIMQPVIGPYMQPTSRDVRLLRELFPGGTGKLGAGVPENPFKGLLDELIDKIRDRFPAATMFVDAAAGIAKQGIESVTKWVSGLAKGIAEKIAGIPGNVVSSIRSWFGAARAPEDFAGTLHDNGGKVPPGRSIIDNRSRHPEALLNAGQWNTMRTIAENVAAGDAAPQPPRMVALRVGDREFPAWVEELAVNATGNKIDAARDRLRWGGKNIGGLL